MKSEKKCRNCEHDLNLHIDDGEGENTALPTVTIVHLLRAIVQILCLTKWSVICDE